MNKTTLYEAKAALKDERDATRRIFVQNYIDTYDLNVERARIIDQYGYLDEDEYEEKHPTKYREKSAEREERLDKNAQAIRLKSIDIMQKLADEVMLAYEKLSERFNFEFKDAWCINERKNIQGAEELKLWYTFISQGGFGFNYVGDEIPSISLREFKIYFYPLFAVVEYKDSSIHFDIIPLEDMKVTYEEQNFTERKSKTYSGYEISRYLYIDKFGNPPQLLMDGEDITQVKTYGKLTISHYDDPVLFPDVYKGRAFAQAINDFYDFIRAQSEQGKTAIANPAIDRLNEMIGLGAVKESIKTLANFIRVNKKRDEMGLKSPSISYHCVFSGNPGTGKTSVARILADIYKELGVLKKGHLVETDRSGLVAEYVGQTAVKTNKVIDSALDGVLFIDEAYSLAQGGSEDFGREAIATLLKRMEDDRDRLVVILAGYTNEIEYFINTNPGLRSRFNRYIHFDDYTAEELYNIFCHIAQKNEYVVSDEAGMYLCEHLEQTVTHKPMDFGNARYVRNLFEKAIEAQANRLASKEELTKQELSLIRKEDLCD